MMEYVVQFLLPVFGWFSHIPAAALAHEMANNMSFLVGGNAIFKTGLENRFCCKAYLSLIHGVGWSYLLVDLLLKRFRSPNAYPRQLQVNWTQLRTNCTQVRVQCVANDPVDNFCWVTDVRDDVANLIQFIVQFVWRTHSFCSVG